jgi:hypothetical protein
MPYERTGYAPWSLTREAGVESATVDGTIQVPQYVYPNLDTGFIDEKGVWQGRKSSDRDFIGFTKAEGVANTGEVLFPDTNNFPRINMKGYRNIVLGVRVSRTGNYATRAVMGPDTQPYANLSPVNAASPILNNIDGGPKDAWTDAFNDSSQEFTQDVWNIYPIYDVLVDQENMQFKMTNNSGGTSDMEFAFMRLL